MSNCTSQRERTVVKIRELFPRRLGAIAGAATVVALAASLTASAHDNAIAAEAKRHVSGQPGKTYEDFIDAVWAFESDIDPTKQDYYNENWNNPVVDEYPQVLIPGWPIRDNDGNPVMEHDLTIEQFFQVIGIGDLYHPSDPNPDWQLIQSNVVNYLGFVGFQFQESDLVDLGYLTFEQKWISGDEFVPVHYVDVPNHYWANGVVAFLAEPPLVDVPTWARDMVIFEDGLFTGKNGVYSYKDFTTPDKHIQIIRDHFTNKYNGIVSGLKARGKTLDDYLGTYLYWNELDPPVSPPPGGRANQVQITMSGLLAGAHLRGAEGVVAMLVDHKNPADENGTYILQYVQDYAGYDTPFGADPAFGFLDKDDRGALPEEPSEPLQVAPAAP